MASYHLRIKTDKKPDGTRVAAIEHLQYIARDGKYKDIDLAKDAERQLLGNTITSLKVKDALNGNEALLYNSPYGNISNTKNGILVTDNPSEETISIALMTAHETMQHEPLIINGSDKFKAQVILAAVNAELPIAFQDEKLNALYKSKLEERHNEHRENRKSNRPNGSAQTIFEHKFDASEYRTITLATEAGFSVPTLSERGLVYYGREDIGLSLSSDENDSMVKQRTKPDWPLRRNVHGLRKFAELSAKQIIKNIENHMDTVFAASHLEYINREAAFAKRGGCIYKSHHLPVWAKDNPKKFFAAADRYEAKDHARYKELEIALPNELNLEQQLEIINEFMGNHLKDFYYAFAIHDKIGMMSDGEHNVHAHIMFSERKIDDAEAAKNRTANHFFAYPKRGAKTLEEKRKGGAPKDRKWVNHAYIAELRKDFAAIQNRILEKYDFIDRVDYRSLKEQRQQAIINGDTFLADLLNRIPEEHINPNHIMQENHPEVENIKKYRLYKKEYQDLLYKTDLLQHQINESENTGLRLSNSKRLSEITLSDEYEHINSELLQELKENLISALDDVHAWQETIISTKAAEEKAMLGFMNNAERELWQRNQFLLKQKNDWLICAKNINKPNDFQTDALAAYEKLMPAIQDKVVALENEITALKPAINSIKEKLSTANMVNKIQVNIAKILHEDKHSKYMLRKANEHLSTAIEAITQVLFDETLEKPATKNIFTAKEIYDILRKRFFGLSKEQRRLTTALQKLSSKVISLNRANKMAEDIFTNGGLKKYREASRQLKKKKEYLENDRLVLADEMKAFQQLSKPHFWQKAEKEKYDTLYDNLKQRNNDILQRQAAVAAQQNHLDKELLRLTTLCSTPTAQEKIAEISAGILKKNITTANQYKYLNDKLQTVNKKLSQIKVQLQAVKVRMSADSPSTHYKVISPAITAKAPPPVTTIANAIAGNNKDVQLVARSTDGDSSAGKEWHMLSELEKDELKLKQVLQEL